MGLFDILIQDKQQETVTEVKQETPIKKSKKRKTLVKEFNELVNENDFEKLKQVFQKCDVNAYGGYNKGNALSFMISEELTRWLIEQGANIEMENRFGATPLYEHASRTHGNVQLLIDLGANIEARNHMGQTPLFSAIRYFKVKNVKILLEAGAKVDIKNDFKETPLLFALKTCRNADIPSLVSIVELLLKHGAKKTNAMKEVVEKIGTDFEWFREAMNEDFIQEVEPSLYKLYQIFDVKPVEKRKHYDGHSPIKVQSQHWQDQHQELWELLVPANGAATTIQGEVIRITGRLSHEILDNGRMNWDKDYQKMTKTLKDYLNLGNQLDVLQLQEIDQILLQILKDQAFEKELARLSELCVKWVLMNTQPITLENTNYNR